MCGLTIPNESYGEESILRQLNELAQRNEITKVGSLYPSTYSFFDAHQMSKRARKKLYEIIQDNHNIETVVLMSRPDLISRQKIAEVRRNLPTQDIIVFMGAESADSFISTYCIDKGYTWSDVEKAAQILREYRVKPAVWILLKPPFLTEKEAIDDTVSSIQAALDSGFEVRLMPNEVMANTLTDLLHKRQRYRPPWLWSIIEVLRHFNTKQLKSIDISGPHFEIPSDTVPVTLHSSEVIRQPHNCPECDRKVRAALQRYKQNRDLSVFDNLECECKKEWKTEIEEHHPPLKERIQTEFRGISSYLLSMCSTILA